MTFLFVLGSLEDNELCGFYKDMYGEIHGTYTAEGVTKLCEGLKGSAMTSLKCVGASRACLSVNAR